MNDASTQSEPLTFTGADAQLDAAGYDSQGFSIEDGFVLCLECDTLSESANISVDAMLTFGQDDGGIGHVFAMACPNCAVKGLLFAGTDTIEADEIDPSITRIVNELVERTRAEAEASQ